MEFQNPSLADIQKLLSTIKNIAVVGLSPKENRPSHRVSKSMQNFGYKIIPVRPAIDNVLGEAAFPDLYAVTDKIDLVNVFRAPDQVDPIVDACIALKIPAIWFQDGVINVPAAQRAVAAGIIVIMDRCIYRDYLQLMT